MSFKELAKATESFQPKRKQFSIEVGGQAMVFTATELSYLDCLDLAVSRRNGGNVYAGQLARSIIDADGQHMSYEQALALPDDVAKAFWEHSQEVNARDDEEKK